MRKVCKNDSNNKLLCRLTAILEDQGEPGRWKFLFQPAMQELRARHPAIDIQLNYTAHIRIISLARIS
ncbi:MAG TPA: hypothetical protein VIP56_06775 [Nitrososphaeraceae archaeon]